MNFLHFFEGCFTVVLLRHLTVIGSYWVLSRDDLDAVWLQGHTWREEPFIVLEVIDAESCTHNDESQGIVFEFGQISFCQLVSFAFFVCELTTGVGDPR